MHWNINYIFQLFFKKNIFVVQKTSKGNTPSAIKDMVSSAHEQIRLTIDYIEALEQEYEALEFGEYE